MTKPRLIGLTGRARHGKDSTAKMLANYGYERVAFADAVREMALVIDPYVPGPYGGWYRLSELVRAVGWDQAKIGVEVRRFLQKLGTEAVRDMIDQGAWIKVGERRIFALLEEGKNVVVTDVRFPNEAAAIARIGAQYIDYPAEVWRVVRPDFDNGLPPLHPSESFVDLLPVDRELRARDLDGLRIRVRAIVETFDQEAQVG